MATEKIRVGIIGANVRNGWGRDAYIPALRALPEFEISAVSTSRQETADETAKHFGIPHDTPSPIPLLDALIVALCRLHRMKLVGVWSRLVASRRELLVQLAHKTPSRVGRSARAN
jgi:hypothetical protein